MINNDAGEEDDEMALAMAISLSLQEQGGSQQVVSASSDQRNSQNNSSGSSSSQSMFGFGGTRSTQYISVGDEPEIAMSSHQPTVVSAVALPAHDQNGSGWMNPSAFMDNHAAAAAAISTDNSPNSNGSGYFDDLSLARMLQAMEFELDAGGGTEEERVERERDGEFEQKEYRASKCRRQLTSLSTFLCFVQIVIFWAMCESEGISSSNPMYGPSSLSLVKWGGKDASLILYRGEWWRLITPLFLHAGVIHLLSNVLIQLRVGGYLNIVFQTLPFTLIYFISGIFGNICSCVFLPDAVGVGSSGALLGILTAWLVWLIFRWKKIPERNRPQRNCQLAMVVICVSITLAMSFTPLVDWSAHFGGALMGLLTGMIFLSRELESDMTRIFVRAGSMAVTIVLYTYSLYYMCNVLEPTREYLEYYDENGV